MSAHVAKPFLSFPEGAILEQTVGQLERMNEALAHLRRECLPGQPKKFALLAEGPLEEIRRLRSEIEQITTEITTADPAHSNSKL